ncbi:MAG: RNA polymerase factor sigma-32 [Gammaproteobacteria bacterium RIFCSPHIGHO2_12_FULL_41_20]|nr:MAG: RNA polymerase factor sigma-32 [Gammaproteobacteria bacterium RIFCSPHIGHO2_12_FULL_41_20]
MTNTDLQKTDILLPINSLEAYMAYANQIPMLSQEEEHQFAIRFTAQNDLGAAKQLILPHLRYVVKVAKGYLGYGLPLADLIQEGNIGLMKAVKRFNPHQGTRLVTFAMHWIKAEIHEFILRNWRIVKVATTKTQRKLFFNLRQIRKHLGWMTEEEVHSVARDLGVKPEAVREMEMRLTATDASYDGHNDSSDDEHAFAPAAFLEDPHANPEEQLTLANWTEQSTDNMRHALAQLDERSQDILRGRWLDEEKVTLQDLANKYQISAERVRQLEKNALDKLRQALVVEGE